MAFDCFRNPPELCSRVARNSFSSRASTRVPASSLWTIATTSFIARSIDAANDAGQRAFRVVYDAGPTDERAGVPPWRRRTAQRSPRVPPRGDRGARRRRRRPRRDALEVSSGSPQAALAPVDGRDLHLRTRTVPSSRSPPRSGWTTQPATLAGEVADPTHPVRGGRDGPNATFDREAAGRGGGAFVGAYLPLARVEWRRRDVRSVSIGLGWPAPYRITAMRPGGARRVRRSRDACRRSRAARLDRRRAVGLVRADGPQRPAHRSRERADGRAGPGARAGASRPSGERGLARDVRRRRLPGDQPRWRAARPATTSCAGSPRCWPSPSDSSTRWAGSVATSSS